MRAHSTVFADERPAEEFEQLLVRPPQCGDRLDWRALSRGLARAADKLRQKHFGLRDNV